MPRVLISILTCLFLNSLSLGQDLIIAGQDGKYGFKKNDEWVIPPKYLQVKPFSEGFAAVEKKAGKWGFINGEGRFILKAKYLAADDFTNGLAVVKHSKFGVVYINTEGTIQIKSEDHYTWGAPFKYEVTFTKGSPKRTYSAGIRENHFLIDRQGQILLRNISKVYEWRNGLIQIERYKKHYHYPTFCYMDSTGTIITPDASKPFDIFQKPLIIEIGAPDDKPRYFRLDENYQHADQGICFLEDPVNGFSIYKECYAPDQKFGLIDEDFNDVLTPSYDQLRYYNDVLVGERNDTFYIIDPIQQLLSQPFNYISPFLSGSSNSQDRAFVNGIAAARTFRKNAPFTDALIDTKGNIVIENLTQIRDGIDGYYNIVRKKPSLQTEYAFMDSTGNIISPWFETSYWEYTPTRSGRRRRGRGIRTFLKIVTGSFIVTDMIGPKFRQSGSVRMGKKNYFNGGTFNSGRALISFNMGFESEKIGNYTYTSTGARYGYINYSGKTVIPATFEQASDFENSVATVCNGHECQIIDTNGRAITEQSFINIGAFVNGLCPVQSADSCWYFVDHTGTRVFDTCFENAQSFSEGYAGIQINGKWGYINLKGEIVLPCLYKSVKPVIRGKGEYFDETGRKYFRAESD